MPDRITELLEKYDIKRPRCGADLPNGWFGIVEKLIPDLIELGWDKDLQQVKEKFGGLRFYIGSGSDAIHDRIRAAEGHSTRTCEVCGGSGFISTKGWWRCLCAEHGRAREEQTGVDDA